MGYSRAGFEVVGVDINPQPFYPFEHYQLDAMDLLSTPDYFDDFDAIHASPPCQFASNMAARYRGKGGIADSRPNLLTPTLESLAKVDIPWVVENVEGAGKFFTGSTFKLHGGMFDLGVHRPRIFQTNWLVLVAKYRPVHEPIGVYGERPDGRVVRYRNNGNWRTAATPKKSVMRVAKGHSRQRIWKIPGRFRLGS